MIFRKSIKVHFHTSFDLIQFYYKNEILDLNAKFVIVIFDGR